MKFIKPKSLIFCWFMGCLALLYGNLMYCFLFRKKYLPLQRKSNRGALILRAEIKPIEPDPGNAGEGKGTGFKWKQFPLLAS
jgi:hypothetical protein